MRTSAGRILTTHTGSLPRPPGLVEALNDKELSRNYDEGALNRTVTRAFKQRRPSIRVWGVNWKERVTEFLPATVRATVTTSPAILVMVPEKNWSEGCLAACGSCAVEDAPAVHAIASSNSPQSRASFIMNSR